MARGSFAERRWAWVLSGMICVALLASPVISAQPAAVGKVVAGAGPSWDSLSAAQRQALAPLSREWPGFSESRKAKWLEVAARYTKLSPEEQQRMHQRMAEWAKLTPTERSRARLTYQENKQLSPEEKQARWEAYNTLTDDHRKAIVEYGQRPATPPRNTAQGLLAMPAADAKAATQADAARAARVKPVSPTVVQAKPGATTLPISKAPTPGDKPPGVQPRIVTGNGQLDRSTLLPRNPPTPARPPASGVVAPVGSAAAAMVVPAAGAANTAAAGTAAEPAASGSAAGDAVPVPASAPVPATRP